MPLSCPNLTHPRPLERPPLCFPKVVSAHDSSPHHLLCLSHDEIGCEGRRVSSSCSCPPLSISLHCPSLPRYNACPSPFQPIAPFLLFLTGCGDAVGTTATPKPKCDDQCSPGPAACTGKHARHVSVFANTLSLASVSSLEACRAKRYLYPCEYPTAPYGHFPEFCAVLIFSPQICICLFFTGICGPPVQKPGSHAVGGCGIPCGWDCCSETTHHPTRAAAGGHVPQG